MANRLLRSAIAARNEWKRLWSALFFDARGQIAALVLGVVFIVAGVLITASQQTLTTQTSAWVSVLIGVGTSIVAAAIVVKILSDKELSLMDNTGVSFVGSRTLIEATFRPSKSATGWDASIERTPRGGELIVIGKKNFQWVKLSWQTIIRTLKKSIPVTFVFMGMTNEEVEKNIADFVNKAKQIDSSGLESPNFSIRRHIPVGADGNPTALADAGYYWNGYDLMAKVYVQNGENYECPIIVFTAPGVSPKFNRDDFDPSLIPLANAEALIQVAHAMAKVLQDSVKV